MKNFVPLQLFIALISVCNTSFSQAVTPFTTCPDVNLGIVRAGMNADVTNPYYMYTVNTTTGSLSVIPGGPLVYPGAPAQTLQVNGVGVNRVDGFVYGLA